MVSAYNLHSDVLGLIFDNLSGSDLVSVALVSRAFLNGVTPRLYHSLLFAHTQSKKYPKIMSPFALLLERPFLGVHVRVCDISAFPLYKGQPNQEFLNECIRALDICPNLMRFRLAPNVLPSFLPTLSRKEKLKELQVNASLTTSQAEVLVSVKGLRSVRLDHASWCLMNLFSRWLAVMGTTLTHLTFTLTSELNDLMLEEILINLPELRCLHVRNCMMVNHAVVFRLVSHTPLLESLSVTTWENPTVSSSSFGGLRNLKHLHLDTRCAISPTTVKVLWGNIIAHTKASNAPLTSLALQLSDKFTLPTSVIEDILDAHAETLTSLRFIKCGVPISSLTAICQRCENLERLAIHVPVKELISFSVALANSRSLQILIDELDPHTTHDIRATLNHDDIQTLMTKTPKLRNIVSESRSWKGSGNVENLQITLERLKNSALPNVMSFA